MTREHDPWGRTKARERFLTLVDAEAERAMDLHRPMNSLHEAYAVILEEVDELWDECRKKRDDRSDDDIRTELIQIAAMALRAAYDLGLLDRIE